MAYCQRCGWPAAYQAQGFRPDCSNPVCDEHPGNRVQSRRVVVDINDPRAVRARRAIAQARHRMMDEGWRPAAD